MLLFVRIGEYGGAYEEGYHERHFAVSLTESVCSCESC